MSTLDATRVFDRSLRGAHEIEGLLGGFVGTLTHESQNTVPSDDRADELECVASRLSNYVGTLTALAVLLRPASDVRNAA